MGRLSWTKEPSTSKVLSTKFQWIQRTRRLRWLPLFISNVNEAGCRNFWIIRNWIGLETTHATQPMQTDHGWFLAVCQTCDIIQQCTMQPIHAIWRYLHRSHRKMVGSDSKTRHGLTWIGAMELYMKTWWKERKREVLMVTAYQACKASIGTIWLQDGICSTVVPDTPSKPHQTWPKEKIYQRSRRFFYPLITDPALKFYSWATSMRL